MAHDYSNAYRLASEFLENVDNARGWRNPEDILMNKLNCTIISFDENDDPRLKSEAYTSFKYGQFFISISKNTPETRKRYTIQHEGGHVIAAHPIIYDNTIFASCAKSTIYHLEIEATIIGRNVFFPAYILYYMIHNTLYDIGWIKQYFYFKYGFSEDYINTRFSFISLDYANMDFNFEIQNEAIKELNSFHEWVIYQNENFLFFNNNWR